MLQEATLLDIKTRQKMRWIKGSKFRQNRNLILLQFIQKAHMLPITGSTYQAVKVCTNNVNQGPTLSVCWQKGGPQLGMGNSE